MTEQFDDLNEDQAEVRTKKANKKTDLKRQNEILDLEWLMESERGRRIYWRILGMCNMHDRTFAGSEFTQFKAGAANVGEKLLYELNATRVLKANYLKMQLESMQEEEKEK